MKELSYLNRSSKFLVQKLYASLNGWVVSKWKHFKVLSFLLILVEKSGIYPVPFE